MGAVEQMEAVGKRHAFPTPAPEWYRAMRQAVEAWPALTELVRASLIGAHGRGLHTEACVTCNALHALAAALPPVPSEEADDGR